MRNSCSSKSARNASVWSYVFSIAIVIGAGHLALAEESKTQPAAVLNGQTGEPMQQTGPLQPVEEISPEIAALYEKYGAYCDAIVDDAREQRYALKRDEIEVFAAELQKRIEMAEAKSANLEKWVRRREEFAKQANSKIVEIYANMRPEASASRLQQLDMNLAASILLAIPPRQASPILNEMDEKNAAAITAVMAASARMDDPS